VLGRGHLTPALQFHGLIEFGNRLVTVVLVHRRGGRLPGRGLPLPPPAGPGLAERWPGRRVLAQAVLGGIVVYTKLNPYLVMVHFFATMLLLVERRRPGPPLHPRLRRDRPASWCPAAPAPALLRAPGPPGLVIAAGTAATGAGPHAGDASGQQIAKRIPIALRDMAELHASLAMLLVGVTIGLGRRPAHGRRARAGAALGRILLVVMVAQAAVGYTQYFTHLPALLVEVHLLGATVLVIGAVQCFLACTYHAPEALPAPLVHDESARGVPIGAH
jgi:cytochrome c oxidase assembly protein subunit 15